MVRTESWHFSNPSPLFWGSPRAALPLPARPARSGCEGTPPAPALSRSHRPPGVPERRGGRAAPSPRPSHRPPPGRYKPAEFPRPVTAVRWWLRLSAPSHPLSRFVFPRLARAGPAGSRLGKVGGKLLPGKVQKRESRGPGSPASPPHSTGGREGWPAGKERAAACRSAGSTSSRCWWSGSWAWAKPALSSATSTSSSPSTTGPPSAWISRSKSSTGTARPWCGCSSGISQVRGRTGGLLPAGCAGRRWEPGCRGPGTRPLRRKACFGWKMSLLVCFCLTPCKQPLILAFEM